jgi:hypothetical protein
MALGAGDYGAPRRNRAVRIWAIALLIGAAVGLALAGGGLGYDWLVRQGQARAQSQALTATFDIRGAPCPALTRAAYIQQGIEPKKAFEFQKVRFARRFGHADCAVVAYRDASGTGGHPVCQFTGPALLAVTADGVESYFAPGVGVPATVSVENGRARCVLAARLGPEFGAAPAGAPSAAGSPASAGR